jgi:8-oxo-dGTP pyrophosphatase MutT (NUDIX family)
MRVLDLFEDDSKHRQALKQTGFWGRRGAGCVIMAQDTGRFCIAHRSENVEQPGTWGTWGGAIDEGEDPAQAVRRELAEEAGYTGAMRLVPLYVFKHRSGFTYYNFLAIVEQEFQPKIDWETQGWDWVEYGAWPSPLHPGLKAVLSDPHSVEVMRRATPPHPQRGSHYPSIETHSLTQPPKTESTITEKNPEQQEIAPSLSSIHRKQQYRRRSHSGEDDWALVKYSSDGSARINDALHRHYRNQNHPTTQYANIERIDNILKQYPLKENLKVYSGIPESPGRIWLKYKADTKRPVRVHLPAFTSTSTDFKISFMGFAKLDYTRLDQHVPRNGMETIPPFFIKPLHSDSKTKVYTGYNILHITVPAGFPALSMNNISSQGPDEKEILLPRGLDIEIDPHPYIKPSGDKVPPAVIWFAKVIGHNPVVIK